MMTKYCAKAPNQIIILDFVVMLHRHNTRTCYFFLCFHTLYKHLFHLQYLKIISGQSDAKETMLLCNVPFIN